MNQLITNIITLGLTVLGIVFCAMVFWGHDTLNTGLLFMIFATVERIAVHAENS
jgi:hypothetical protein